MTRKADWLWPLRPLAPLADQMDAFIKKRIAPHASKLTVNGRTHDFEGKR